MIKVAEAFSSRVTNRELDGDGEIGATGENHGQALSSLLSMILTDVVLTEIAKQRYRTDEDGTAKIERRTLTLPCMTRSAAKSARPIRVSVVKKAEPKTN